MSQSRLFYASQALMVCARDFDAQEIASIENSLKVFTTIKYGGSIMYIEQEVISAMWGHNAVRYQNNAEIALCASVMYYLCILRSGKNISHSVNTHGNVQEAIQQGKIIVMYK